MIDLERREEIYLEYQEKVLRYVRGKISNPHDAEDLVSGIFTKIYENLDRFDQSKASLSTWIYSITQHTVVDWFRTSKSYCELPEGLSSSEDLEGSLLQDETLEALAQALETLQERERDLIILHYYSGYTLKAIAESMGISYTTAKVTHKAALGRLRKAMDGYGA